MAEKILSGKIKQLVYTTEELSQEPLSTTIIDDGILVYEKTSSGQIKCKMGDGNNVWNGLDYIEDMDKMNKNNPEGTGSLSMNRANGSNVGEYSVALGSNCVASGDYSHAEGYCTTVSGNFGAHAEGSGTKATANASHVEGSNSITNGDSSHAEGHYTIASSQYQHVQGKYNVEDSSSIYAHIVGGGTSDDNRKNIHTLDWNGNAVFSGDVTATNPDGTEVSLLSLQNSSGSGGSANIQASTTDLVSGVSELATGTLYVVYDE